MDKKILVSGVKPTGRPHIGNYFGAMKQWVDLQHEYDSYLFIADLHALNFIQNAGTLKSLSYDLILDYLGIGLDPEKITFFKQSDIHEHAELTWIFDTLVTVSFMMRAHAYKDAVAKNEEPTMGLFNYPVLMASDILLYDPEIVPVGKDQKQHIEYARDIAQKFNHVYGETFSLPKDLILEDVAIVPGTDGQKMSKSYGNTIPLFGTDDEIKKAVMSIVTDSSGDVPANVYAIHKLFKTEAELAPLYNEKKGKYKDLKDALLADILAFVAPMRTKREYYANNPELVAQILKSGADKARVRASAKMATVRKAVGLD